MYLSEFHMVCHGSIECIDRLREIVQLFVALYLWHKEKEREMEWSYNIDFGFKLILWSTKWTKKKRIHRISHSQNNPIGVIEWRIIFIAH